MREFICENKKVIIKNMPPPQHSDAYISAREKVWAGRVEVMKGRNQPFWNGTVYYLDSLEENDNEVLLTISTCEYKDIALKETQQIDENVLSTKPYICVQCLIVDACGQYLFGVGEGGRSILVGGTLRKEDFDVDSASDIDRYALKEIEVETDLEVNQSFLKLDTILEDRGVLTFLFVYKPEIKFIAGKNYLKRGEFISEYIVNKMDLLSKESDFNERLASVKTHLSKIAQS